jgi:hypothetical protein
MAKVDRAYLRQAGEGVNKLPDRLPPARAKAPVQIKLERINCDVAKSLPPDGDHEAWVDRLKAALGTASSEFVNTTLFQL